MLSLSGKEIASSFTASIFQTTDGPLNSCTVNFMVCYAPFVLIKTFYVVFFFSFKTCLMWCFINLSTLMCFSGGPYLLETFDRNKCLLLILIVDFNPAVEVSITQCMQIKTLFLEKIKVKATGGLPLKSFTNVLFISYCSSS